MENRTKEKDIWSGTQTDKLGFSGEIDSDGEIVRKKLFPTTLFQVPYSDNWIPEKIYIIILKMKVQDNGHEKVL